MSKLCYTILFLCYTSLCIAQKIDIPKNRIPVHQDEFQAWVMVYEDKVKTSKLDNKKTYYWLKAKKIHSSKGGYDGHLLHDEYTALYKNDALKEKGRYVKGLKHGEWKEWHPNGELKLISQWNCGFQSGTFLYYNESGILLKKEFYRKGTLHGKQFSYSDSTETIQKYKRGRLIVPKVKRKKEKVEVVKGEEIKEEGKAVEPVKAKERKKWFKRKEKVDKAEEKPSGEKNKEKESREKKKREKNNVAKG